MTDDQPKIILDRTCEMIDDRPHLRRMKVFCGKPAVGDVKSGALLPRLICADCIKDVEAANARAQELNRSNMRHIQSAPTWEITKW